MHDFEIGFYLYSKLDFLIFHFFFKKKGLIFVPKIFLFVIAGYPLPEP